MACKRSNAHVSKFSGWKIDVFLSRYFEAHLAVKAEQVKQSLHSSDGSTVVPQQPFYKVSRDSFFISPFVQTSFEMYGVFTCGSHSPGVYVHQRAGH